MPVAVLYSDTNERLQAVSCVKSLRAASVAHIMGQRYNDYLAVMKAKYQRGDNSDIWEMVRPEWTLRGDGFTSLGMS